MIKIPLSVGSIVLGGKFKNKPIEIASFSTDEYNQPIIITPKGKKIKLLAVRIKSIMPNEKKMKQISAKKKKEKEQKRAAKLKKENLMMTVKDFLLTEDIDMTEIQMGDTTYNVGLDNGCLVLSMEDGESIIHLNDDMLSLLGTLKDIISQKYGDVKNFTTSVGENPAIDKINNMLTTNIL